MPQPQIRWSQRRVFFLCNILCYFCSSWFSFFTSGPSFLSSCLPVFIPSSLPFIPNKKQGKETAVKVSAKLRALCKPKVLCTICLVSVVSSEGGWEGCMLSICHACIWQNIRPLGCCCLFMFFNLSPRPWKDFLLTWKTERWKGYVIFISSHAATTRDHGLKSAPWNHCSLHPPLPRSLWLSVLSGTNLHSEAGARELHIFPLTSPRSFLPLDSAREAWEAHRDPCFVVRMLLGNLCAAHFLNSWHLGLTEAGSLPPENMGIFQSYTK